jgi:hypothetical protein
MTIILLNSPVSSGPHLPQEGTCLRVLVCNELTSSVAYPTVAQFFNKQLVPGQDDRTLTYAPQGQGLVGYNDTNVDGSNAIRLGAGSPSSAAMAIFFPDMATQIGQLDFDPLNVGHECEVILNGTHYQGNTASGARLPLVFTDGSVLLSA